MEQHQFKAISSYKEENVYHIIDLTDTSIVGITVMSDDDEKIEKELAAEVADYGIFICLDTYNVEVNLAEYEYIRSVLQQMATFFKKNVIDNNPSEFCEYCYLQEKTDAPVSPDKPLRPLGDWKEDWWIVCFLVLIAAAVIAFIVCLIVFPRFREIIGTILGMIVILPFTIGFIALIVKELFSPR